MEDFFMDGKTILLFIAVIAVGMFVLPSTLALYTGQHEFVGANDVDCGKCHGSVAGDGSVGGELKNGTAHETMDCGACHSNTWAGVDTTANTSYDYSTGGRAHAAGIGINCIGCHSNSTYVNSTMTATKDGAVNVSQELMAPAEAHTNMDINSSQTGGINDRDLVCVACHTNVNVDIYNMSVSTNNNITIDGGSGSSDWMYAQND